MRRKCFAALLCGLIAFVFCGCSPDIPQEKRAVHDLRVPAETVGAWLDEGRDVLFVDLRSEADWQDSSEQLPGAVRVQSYQGVETLVQTVSKDRYVVAYCTVPNEGASAGLALMLRDNGFDRAYALIGGWDAWVQAGYPVVEKMPPKE